MKHSNLRWTSTLSGMLFIAGLTCGGLGACADTPEAAVADGVEAATLEEVEGKEVSRITLTEKASSRLGLTTEAIQAPADDGGLQIPYSALLYDAEGATWVYTNPEPLVFVREPVTVERIEAGTVRLVTGPGAGVDIVTVGAAELLGAELDTAH